MREEEIKGKVDFFIERCKSYLEQDGLLDGGPSFERTAIEEMFRAEEEFVFAEKSIETQTADNTNTSIYFCKISGEIKKEDLTPLLLEKMSTIVSDKVIIIAHVESLSHKVLFEAASKCIKVDKKKVVYYSTIVNTNYDSDGATSFEIERYNLIKMPPIDTRFSFGLTAKEDKKEECKEDKKKEQNEPIEGYIFTAKLIDLIKMYNAIGDILFEQNVRYRIGDALGVDKAIEKTLKEAPQDFWYLNNGVTITVKAGCEDFSNPQQLCLYHSDKKKKNRKTEVPFSVINGAQTISSSAECYYSMKQEGCDVKSIEEKACVLVKVFVIPEEQKGKAGEFAIALNRQKPIKIEDIAYTVPMVEEINAYALEKGIKLHINKRGESDKGINLAWFARINKACQMKPHEARNSAANKLLKCDPTVSFTDDQLHSKDFHDEEKREGIFMRYFMPIPAVVALLDKYDKYVKKLEDKLNPDEMSILRNTRWHYVSYVLLCLGANPKMTEIDYTDWDTKKLDACLLDETKMLFCMEHFAQAVKNEGIKTEDYKNDSVTEIIKRLAESDKGKMTVTGLPQNVKK